MSRDRVRTGSVDSTTVLAAERAVIGGAHLLKQGRAHFGAIIDKGDRDFATTIDVAIEEAVRRELADATPGIPFLGEEEGGTHLGDGLAWVLDPIDGTANFAKGSPLCGISLALVDGDSPVLGLIDLPLLGERYLALEGAGAFLNGNRIEVADVEGMHEAMIGFADFSIEGAADLVNSSELLRTIAQEAQRVRIHGSAALDLAWLAAGRLNGTVMLSSKPWDVLAGVLLVREAGGRVFDLEGRPYTSASSSTLACGPRLAAAFQAAIAAALS